MIAVFTDFGIQGPYLGQMKAAIARVAPSVQVVDLFPDLPPFNVRAAACLLPAYSRYFAEQTIFLCVVDPGVGSDRRGLVIHSKGCHYVGPDNGLFSAVLASDRNAECREIRWRPEILSRSFHGRDWFAPVAASLALGSDLEMQSVDRSSLVGVDWPVSLAEIVYIDAYGNAITGLSADTIDVSAWLSVSNQRIESAGVFADVKPGQAFWYENSNGLLEIAVNRGSAARALGLHVGSAVVVLP